MKLLHASKAFLFQKKNVKFNVSIPVPSFKTFRLRLNFGISQFVSDGPNEHFLVYVLSHMIEVPLSICGTTSYLRCNSVGIEHFTLKKREPKLHLRGH